MLKTTNPTLIFDEKKTFSNIYYVKIQNISQEGALANVICKISNNCRDLVLIP